MDSASWFERSLFDWNYEYRKTGEGVVVRWVVLIDSLKTSKAINKTMFTRFLDKGSFNNLKSKRVIVHWREDYNYLHLEESVCLYREVYPCRGFENVCQLIAGKCPVKVKVAVFKEDLAHIHIFQAN
jgi:hypothetical protein